VSEKQFKQDIITYRIQKLDKSQAVT